MDSIGIDSVSDVCVLLCGTVGLLRGEGTYS